MTRVTRSFFILPIVCGIACGQIAQEAPLDKDGKPIKVPPPLESWLQVESITPLPDENVLSDSPSFLITFNQYLQEDTARSYGVVSLQTGARGTGGSYEPVMVERGMVWTPYQPLQDTYEYTLRISGDGLESVTGAPPPPMYSRQLIFRVDATREPEAPLTLRKEEVTWTRVHELFTSRGCYTCHGDPSWHALNPLTYDSLVDARAAQSSLYLVRFKDPTNSYLMHKLLPDYPIRRGTLQPPPWSEGSRPLAREELWLVEQWIRQGARQ